MRSTHSRPLAALLAVLALVASACGGDDAEPSAELADAVQALADSTFAYAVALDIDPDAAESLLGPDAGMASGLLGSVAVRGVKGDGSFSFGAAVMGIEPFSVRSYDGGQELFLRVGVAQMLQAAGGGADLGLDTSAFEDLPGDGGEIMRRLLDGEWVGFVGLDPDSADDDQEQAASELGLDLEQFQELGDDLRARVGELEQLLDDVANVSRTEENGRKHFDVEIRTEPALRELQTILAPFLGTLDQQQDAADLEADLQDMLEDAPPTIPGLRATVTDGDLTEIVLDIGALVAAFDSEQTVELGPDQVLLRVAFTEHGSAAVPDRPEDATTYDQQQFEQLSELLADPSVLFGALPGSTPPAGTGGADQQAALLASLELAWFDANGSYTDNVAELLAFDESAAAFVAPGASYGACTVDDGQGFVVGASVDGEVAYYDSNFVAYETAAGLPCEPTLSDVTG